MQGMSSAELEEYLAALVWDSFRAGRSPGEKRGGERKERELVAVP
jgi:hypothetical protein